ncbi:MAG: hypothetical protein ACOWWH_12185 [Eubacteriaceae bacterium]
MNKIIVYQDNRNGISRNVWAFIKEGCLHIEGQDLGDIPFGSRGEYEFFYTFNKEETRKLALFLELPETGDELLGKIKKQFKGSDWSTKFREFVDNHGLGYEFNSWF